MPITCECPQCGKRLKAADSAAGKKAKCPDCGAAVPIPARKPKKAPAEDDEFDLQKLNVDAGMEGPIEEDQVPCPMCGEMIKAAATKCRYCGEDLAAAKRKSKRKKRSATSDDETLTASDWLLALICANIGCIMSVVYMVQGKPKGLKMLGASALGQLIGFTVGFFFGALNFLTKK